MGEKSAKLMAYGRFMDDLHVCSPPGTPGHMLKLVLLDWDIDAIPRA
jgi:hypothetical protein